MTKKSFHLRWNNHLQNLQNLFENLYNEQSLVDVTISCSDGLLYGHKLVLSACSPYFEQIFKNNPCKHPVLILKGIKQYAMKVLLEFMYIGSVDVGEDDLEMLLDTASELQIKGLVQTGEETLQNSLENNKSGFTSCSSRDSQNASPVSQHYDDKTWQSNLTEQSTGSKHKENNPQKKQLKNLSTNVMDSTNNTNIMTAHHEDNFLNLDSFYSNPEIKHSPKEYQEVSEERSEELAQLDIVEETSEDVVGIYKFREDKPPDNEESNYFCHTCSRAFLNKGSYHRHMLTHAGVKPHHCTFCDQSFLRLSHLQRHIRVHTGERPYVCNVCPKQFARSDKLRQHYIIQHNHTNGLKISKPRGRPRKNLTPYMTPTSNNITPINSLHHNTDIYAPSSSSSGSAMNSLYPVSIRPVTMKTT